MAVNVIVDGLETGPLCLRGEGTLSISGVRRIVTDSLDNHVSGISVAYCLDRLGLSPDHPCVSTARRPASYSTPTLFQGLKNVRFRLQMHSRVLEDDEVLECGQGDSFLTISVIPSLQGGKGGEWDRRPKT